MSNLIHTVAKVSFAALPSEQLEAIEGKLHEALRVNYPFFECVVEQVVTINLVDTTQSKAKQSDKQYRLTSVDKHWGIIVSAGNVIVHTDEYVSFNVLASKMEEVLTLLNQLITINHTLYIGIRYFNQLGVIDDHEDFSFNIKRPEILQPILNCQPYIAGNRMRSVYENDEGFLVLQSGIVVQGPLLPVEYSPLLYQLGKHNKPITGVCGYVDIDSCHRFDKAQIFEMKSIIGKLDRLRLQAKAAYEEVIGDIRR